MTRRMKLGRRIAATGAALLIAATGASIPTRAETSGQPVLVPATIQSSGFEAAFADLALSGPQAKSDDEATAEEPASTTATPIATEIQGGMASWYGREFAGRRTASGENFDPADLTAAHRTLPFGSLVRVTNARTGHSVVVRINDRGPFKRDRVIDVSQAAARELGLIGPGSGTVSLVLLD